MCAVQLVLIMAYCRCIAMQESAASAQITLLFSSSSSAQAYGSVLWWASIDHCLVSNVREI